LVAVGFGSGKRAGAEPSDCPIARRASDGGMPQGAECGLTLPWSWRRRAGVRQASAGLSKTSSFGHASRRLPLRLSMKAFCCGLPGSAQGHATPFSLAHLASRTFGSGLPCR
jgi:hypothetical protein